MRPGWLAPGRADPLARLDAWRFAPARADYYDYLHAILRGMAGRRTLRDVFELDARRYGPRSVRGRLSAGWALSWERSGGDLRATWWGSFPRDELVLLRAAQAFGNERLLGCFEALASHARLMAEARRILAITLGTAVLALLVASLLALALPLYTVPGLMGAFQGVPPEWHGPYARSLFALSGWLARHGPLVPLAAAAVSIWAVAHLPRTTGAWRRLLDRHGLWRLYRLVQALRVLALLEILLAQEAGGSVQLRTAVAWLAEGARPWLARHLDAVLAQIDRGWAGAASLDTGLLDRDLYWLLEDVSAACGLQAGLRAARSRLASQLLGRVARQAQALRWLVLLAVLGWVMGAALWHYAAIDELRRAWMMFHAGQ